MSQKREKHFRKLARKAIRQRIDTWADMTWWQRLGYAVRIVFLR